MPARSRRGDGRGPEARAEERAAPFGYLTARQSAALLGLRPGALYQRINRGAGPRFCRVGGYHLLFHVDDLVAYARERGLRPRSVAEAVEADRRIREGEQLEEARR